MAFELPPLPFPKEPGTNNPYIATPDEGGGYTVPSGHYFKKKVGDLHLWIPVSESDPLPTDNANIDVALSALRDALLGTGNKTLSDLATALEPLATSEKQAELVSALGVIADAAVSDPAASGTVISLLKGLLSQLQDGSPVSVTESSLPTGAATAAQQEAARVLLDTLSKKDYSTAAKQDALAAVVGALDAAAVSDPAAAGTLVALLKGVLERLQTVEGKIDGITDGTTPATTQLTGSFVAYDGTHDAIKTVNASLLHESFDFKDTKEVTVSPGSYLVDTYRPTNGYAQARIIAKRIGAAHNWRLNANWSSDGSQPYQVVEKLHTASSTDSDTQTAKIVTSVGSQWVSMQLFNDDAENSHDYHVHMMLTAG